MLDQRVRKHAIALDNMLAWQQAIVRTFMKHDQHVLPAHSRCARACIMLKHNGCAGGVAA